MTRIISSKLKGEIGLSLAKLLASPGERTKVSPSLILYTIRNYFKQSLQHFLLMQDAKQKQIVTALKDIDRIAEDTKTVAANTNAKAYENGEQLQRIEGKLNGINGQLVKAQDNAKEITSFWYYLKKKVKGVFGIKNSQPTCTYNKGVVPKDERKEVQEKQYKEIKGEKGVSEEDEAMDSILSNLGQIKKYGKDLGDELDKQNKRLQRIDPEMDKAINKIGKVNKILKKELS